MAFYPAFFPSGPCPNCASPENLVRDSDSSLSKFYCIKPAEFNWEKIKTLSCSSFHRDVRSNFSQELSMQIAYVFKDFECTNDKLLEVEVLKMLLLISLILNIQEACESKNLPPQKTGNLLLNCYYLIVCMRAKIFLEENSKPQDPKLDLPALEKELKIYLDAQEPMITLKKTRPKKKSRSSPQNLKNNQILSDIQKTFEEAMHLPHNDDAKIRAEVEFRDTVNGLSSKAMQLFQLKTKKE